MSENPGARAIDMKLEVVVLVADIEAARDELIRRGIDVSQQVMHATFGRPQWGPSTTTAQVRLSRSSPAYCRVTFDNPPLNLMGPEFVLQMRQIVTELESDAQVPGDAETRLGFHVGQLGR